MGALVITESLKDELDTFLQKNKKTDLITAYLFFLGKKFNISPVLYVRDKTIYQSTEDLLKRLEAQGKLWRETEIMIQTGPQGVNQLTKKVYICPFTGKVFGNNTHPNPQDAIYDWVAKCSENKERIGGLKVKRFFVSEDPEIIANYIVKRKDPIKKIVFSSAATGKLFNSKNAIIEDFLSTQLKSTPLTEVQNQNKFQIEEHFLAFIQKQLEEAKVAAFVEALSYFEVFAPFLDVWLEEENEEA